MTENAQSTATTGSKKAIEECVEFARANGVGNFPLDRRSQVRIPFVYPVRFCLGPAPTEDHTQPGHTLDINSHGLAICCRHGLPAGAPVWVLLPLSDGRLTWLSGTVVHCEPDAEHYRAGIAFTTQNHQP